MTDETVKRIAGFYNEVNGTAVAIEFLKNCAVFSLTSGSRVCSLPNGLQYLIREAVETYYKELKEKQKEL